MTNNRPIIVEEESTGAPVITFAVALLVVVFGYFFWEDIDNYVRENFTDNNLNEQIVEEKQPEVEADSHFHPVLFYPVDIGVMCSDGATIKPHVKITIVNLQTDKAKEATGYSFKELYEKFLVPTFKYAVRNAGASFPSRAFFDESGRRQFRQEVLKRLQQKSAFLKESFYIDFGISSVELAEVEFPHTMLAHMEERREAQRLFDREKVKLNLAKMEAERAKYEAEAATLRKDRYE